MSSPHTRHGCSNEPFDELPPPRQLGLFVIGAFSGIAVRGLVAVLGAERLTETQRMIAAGVIVLVIALLTMWMIFAWPAY